MIKEKKHLTIAGLEQIAKRRATSNHGFSPENYQGVISYFPSFNPVPRALVRNRIVPNPHWFAGFVSIKNCKTVNR
jgi:hypothetical protein